MSDIYVGELQDYEGNTTYPHTIDEVVFLSDEGKDNTSLKDFLKKKSDEEMGVMIDAILMN